MATKTEIVKVDPKEYGIEENKAKEIAAQFQPMLDKMVALEGEFNEISKLSIEDPETSKKAKDLRLKYVKIRTGTAEIHKQQKAFYLSAGRFVDGWKNTQLFASNGIEIKLQDIEKHAERLEEQRVEKLQKERQEKLAPYNVENADQLALGVMTDEIWNNFLLGMKTSHENKIAAEKKAEADRIALEKKEAAEREKQRLENIRLKDEAEKKEKALEAERKRVDAEKSKADAEAQRLKDEAEKKLAAEKAKAKELADKVKAKEDEEKRIADAKIAAEQKLAAAPDKKKLEAFAKTIEDLIQNHPELEFKSAGAEKILGQVDIMMTKVSAYIREKSAKL